MPHSELLKFTPVIATALCGSGIYGLLYPHHVAKELFGTLGATERETLYYRPMAGRNLAMGIAVGFYTYWRDERALGTIILCLLCNGFSDTYILLAEPKDKPVKNVWIHVMNIGIGAVVGSGLLGWW